MKFLQSPKYCKFYVDHESLSKFMIIICLSRDNLETLYPERKLEKFSHLHWVLSSFMLIFGFSVLELTINDFKSFGD